MLSKSLQLIKARQNDIFLGICVVLISVISYNLGQTNSRAKLPIKISNQNNVYQASAIQSLTDPNSTNIPIQKTKDLRVIASKNSALKKYHYLWCPGAKKIKEQNKLWFASFQEAESKGYALAGNCQL